MLRSPRADLRGNGLGDAGAVVTGSNSKVWCLSTRAKNPQMWYWAGAAHLARALREHINDALAELDLGYNEIKDQGACAIAQVPRQRP